MLDNFYEGKKVLVTGHTGFKGSWMCRMLNILGADVFGYALEPPTEINLYELLKSDTYVHSKKGDISDFEKLSEYYSKIKPDVVFHLAAQPLVRIGYREPRETYLTNVMGTVNILECVRLYGSKSVLNVTTDKVYDNVEDSSHEYKEDERLDGYDPYSNSKSCSELVTHSYVRSFLNDRCPVSTARAGNVIGGGDFAQDRIIPDCVRAAITGSKVIIRNPNSIRPYQHVLEPLFSYLVIAMKQYNNLNLAGSYNIGPEKDDCVTTEELTRLFCEQWSEEMDWVTICDGGPHEANYLKLDNSKMKKNFGISPMWGIREAIVKTVEWSKVWSSGGDVIGCTDSQIIEYLNRRGLNI